MNPGPFNPRAMGALCNQCPLNDKRPCAPTGKLTAALAFVGDAPGRYEELNGKLMQGDGGAKLGTMLYKYGVTRDEVYVTASLLCRPETPGIEGKRRFDLKVYAAWFRKQNMMRKKAGHPVQEDPWSCCKPRLDFELAWLDYNAKQAGRPNGAVVMPLGNFALKAVTGGVEGKIGGVMKYRGSVIPVGEAVQAVAAPSENMRTGVTFEGGAERIFGTIPVERADEERSIEDWITRRDEARDE